jgi:RNA polymerase sigma-70 factor, ECF subfamily
VAREGGYYGVGVDELTRSAWLARSGDRAAAGAFIRATQAQVWRLCAHLVDAQTAEDLTQETYLRAFRALPAFRAEASARTWLLGIARRACMDELRARVRQRRRDSLLTNNVVAGGNMVPDVANQSWADAAPAQLSAERRAAFVLTQLLGYSYAKAAEICACPVGTIRSRVARAREDLVAWTSTPGVPITVRQRR